jgi:hypothetical protein
MLARETFFGLILAAVKQRLPMARPHRMEIVG